MQKYANRLILFAMLILPLCQTAYAYNIGDEVKFLHWGYDSQKEVEFPGVIIGRNKYCYVILPKYQICRGYNYVVVNKNKIVHENMEVGNAKTRK